MRVESQFAEIQALSNGAKIVLWADDVGVTIGSRSDELIKALRTAGYEPEFKWVFSDQTAVPFRNRRVNNGRISEHTERIA